MRVAALFDVLSEALPHHDMSVKQCRSNEEHERPLKTESNGEPIICAALIFKTCLTFLRHVLMAFSKGVFTFSSDVCL